MGSKIFEITFNLEYYHQFLINIHYKLSDFLSPMFESRSQRSKTDVKQKPKFNS